jgi:hypothetical protein
MGVNYLFDKDLLVGYVDQNGEMVRYERENKTETYVVIPPAFVITDSDGACWTLGNEYTPPHNGEFELNVLRNGVDTGEVAKRIEYRIGKVRIFGHYGWKSWSRSGKTFI